MGKKLDAFIKRQKIYHRNRRLEKFKSPFDCPKCLGQKQLIVTKSEAGGNTTWEAGCGVCGFHITYVNLAPATEAIDIFNDVCDKLRKGLMEVKKNDNNEI